MLIYNHKTGRFIYNGKIHEVLLGNAYKINDLSIGNKNYNYCVVISNNSVNKYGEMVTVVGWDLKSGKYSSLTSIFSKFNFKDFYKSINNEDLTNLLNYLKMQEKMEV